MTGSRKPRLIIFLLRSLRALALGLLGAAVSAPLDAAPLRLRNTTFQPVVWDDIAGWSADDHAAAYQTFLASCRAIVKNERPARDPRPVYRALHAICRQAVEKPDLKGDDARRFFETHFVPARISPAGETLGFITGYYEPIVEGARFPSDKYTVPLYRSPSNLITSGSWRPNYSGKGKTGRRVGRRKIVSYYDRTQIEEGVLAGRELEICWLKDPIDSFFAQIQGSTRVVLEDGKMLRLNYASANGHPYTAVGRFLIERGIVSKEEMSMQKIRQFMEANPEEGKELRRKNKSFVFFRETALKDNEEAIGAQGIPLTARRSIAVDKNLHVYGTPFFLDAYLPMKGDYPDTDFRHLMIAQDTGGAIVGPARADIYWGAGTEPETIAGRLKHFGNFVMLVPKELNPFVASDKIPLPRPRPPEQVIAKADTKADAKPQPAMLAPKPATAPEPKAKLGSATPKPARKHGHAKPAPAKEVVKPTPTLAETLKKLLKPSSPQPKTSKK
jgi:membrane-bound lytic murein transglycosylase A